MACAKALTGSTCRTLRQPETADCADAKLGRRIARYLAEIEDFFRRTIRAARANGSMAPGLNAKDVARRMLGIRMLARSKPDQPLLEGIERPWNCSVHKADLNGCCGCHKPRANQDFVFTDDKLRLATR